MARTSNLLVSHASGSIGKQLVFKNYNGKTVITSHPDMSKVKWSKLQEKKWDWFAEAVAYAKTINNNPAKKAAYKKKLKKGQSVYHAAISEFMKRKSDGK